MKLTTEHQKVFDKKFPKGYNASALVRLNGKVVDESGVFHIMYIKIMKDGKRVKDVPSMQKYTVQDWEKTIKVLEDSGVGVTGYDEFAIIHDPLEAAREAEAEIQAEAERKAKIKAEAKEAAEFEAALKAEAKEKAVAEKAEAEVKPEAKPKGRPPQNKQQ